MAGPAYLNPYSSFERLYYLWKNEQRPETRLTAIILSTEMPGLDKKFTHFVTEAGSILDNLSGPEVAIYVSSNNKYDETNPTEQNEFIRNKYKEISYSIGRLLKVSPEQFP